MCNILFVLNIVCLEQFVCRRLMCLSQFPFFLIRLGLFGHFYGAVITSSASRQKKEKKVISHAGQCVMNHSSVYSDVSETLYGSFISQGG